MSLFEILIYATMMVIKHYNDYTMLTPWQDIYGRACSKWAFQANKNFPLSFIWLNNIFWFPIRVTDSRILKTWNLDLEVLKSWIKTGQVKISRLQDYSIKISSFQDWNFWLFSNILNSFRTFISLTTKRTILLFR